MNLRWLSGLLTALLWLAAAVTLAPFAYLICGSLKPSSIWFSSLFLPPGEGLLGVDWGALTLDAYRQLFTELDFSGAMFNSLFLASTVSLAATLTSAAGGYTLAFGQWRGQKFAWGAILWALSIPPPLLLAPGYENLFRLGLLDSWAGLILPASVSAFGLFLFRQAAKRAVNPEVLDAARLDGCSELRIFFSMVLPMLRPTAGAFTLITFLGMWNNFLSPQIVLQDPDRFPLSVALANLKGMYVQDYGLISAGTVVSIAPVIFLFLLLQKDLVSGLQAGLDSTGQREAKDAIS